MLNIGIVALVLFSIFLYQFININPAIPIQGYIGYIATLLATGYAAIRFLLPPLLVKTATAKTTGIVEEVKPNGTFVGGYHQPLYNAKISYLGRTKVFKDLPPSFNQQATAGDQIQIIYNPMRPSIAFVDFDIQP